MASWVSYPLFTNIIVALSVNMIIVFLFPTLPNLVKSPSQPNDVQPVQPRQVSQPIPRYLYAPGGISPVLEGLINATNPLKWDGACFRGSTASLKLNENSATVFIQLGKPVSFTCVDHYFFITSEILEWDFYIRQQNAVKEFQWTSQSEREFIEKWGVILVSLPTWPSEDAQESRAM